MDRLKETLDQLVQTDVIAPVLEPTKWVNSLVVTEKKNGSLRLCLDPRELNRAIRRQHFTIHAFVMQSVFRQKCSRQSISYQHVFSRGVAHLQVVSLQL